MNEEQRKIIDDFTSALDDLDFVLADVPEEGWDWSEKEGEWSIRQIIHHLAEDCNVYAFIIERGLATPGCKVFFGDFPSNIEWSNLLAWNERSVEIARELMHAHRKFLADLAGHFPERWDNKVMFFNESKEKIAEQSVEKMLVMLTEHMQEHVETVKKILKINHSV